MTKNIQDVLGQGERLDRKCRLCMCSLPHKNDGADDHVNFSGPFSCMQNWSRW